MENVSATDPFQWRDLAEVLVVLLGIDIIGTALGCALWDALKALWRRW